MENLKIYRVCDCDWVATLLPLKETISWYEKEIGDSFDESDFEEVDADKNGMFYSLNDGSVQPENLVPAKEATFGDFSSFHGEVCEYVSFREAYKRDGLSSEIYIIASTEW